MAVSVAVYEIASDKESCDLENEVRRGPLQCVTTICRSLSSFDADVHKLLYSRAMSYKRQDQQVPGRHK